MPQGAFYVFADVSRWTDDSSAFAFVLLEKAGVGVAPGVDFGLMGKRAVRFSLQEISCPFPSAIQVSFDENGKSWVEMTGKLPYSVGYGPRDQTSGLPMISTFP